MLAFWMALPCLFIHTPGGPLEASFGGRARGWLSGELRVKAGKKYASESQDCFRPWGRQVGERLPLEPVSIFQWYIGILFFGVDRISLAVN